MVFKTLIIVLGVLVPTIAFAQSFNELTLIPQHKNLYCADHADLKKVLNTQYKEQSMMLGLAQIDPNIDPAKQTTKFYVSIFQNEYTFTIVETHITGLACMLATGVKAGFKFDEYQKFIGKAGKDTAL